MMTHAARHRWYTVLMAALMEEREACGLSWSKVAARMREIQDDCFGGAS